MKCIYDENKECPGLSQVGCCRFYESTDDYPVPSLPKPKPEPEDFKLDIPQIVWFDTMSHFD